MIAQVTFTPIFNTATGRLEISTPLPVKPDLDLIIVGGGVVYIINDKYTWPSGTTNLTVGFNSNDNAINVRCNGTNQNTWALLASNLTSNEEHNLGFSGSYITSEPL